MSSGNGGDTNRVMAALWRHERPGVKAGPMLGRKPKLAVDEVVAVAVDLADADGLETLSMNRLARALDVGTMTLYTYVRSRTELVALMVDDVLMDRTFPGPGERRPCGWRAQVELYADRTREMFRVHPWLRSGASIEPPLGPGLTTGKEFLFSALSRLELTARQQSAAANAVAFFVDASAAFELAGERRDPASDIADAADSAGEQEGSWWDDAFDPDRFPATVAVWHDGGFDLPGGGLAGFSRDFGFTRLLDGIEAMASAHGAAETKIRAPG